MEKDKNIFETAAKKLGRKAIKAETEKPKAQNRQKEAMGPDTYRDPEVNDMMKQIREMKQDLQAQIETISKKTGISYDDLKKMMENPKNFSPGDWEMLQKNKELLGEKVWGVVGVPNKPKPKQRENLAGERKAKTLGARKKWIPMR